MLDLLVLRDRLRGVYAKHGNFIDAAVRFFTALLAMALLNSGIGYMKQLLNPVIPIALALICSVCPWGGICWILALFMLAHIFAASVELALTTAAFLLIVALLYYGFTPGDSWIMILTPLLFALKIPYLIPILVGFLGSMVSVVPMSCGIVIYYILEYARANARPIAEGSASGITQQFVQMLTGIFGNRTMLLYIIAFAITLIAVRQIRSMSVDNSWHIAIIAGILLLLLSMFLGIMMFRISLKAGSLAAGCAVSFAAGEILRFFLFHVDYSRTEYTQFEDDDYYYYVKAVPKISVSAPEPRVQKLNRARKRRSREDSDTKR